MSLTTEEAALSELEETFKTVSDKEADLKARFLKMKKELVKVENDLIECKIKRENIFTQIQYLKTRVPDKK